jgi:hypothetical protein
MQIHIPTSRRITEAAFLYGAAVLILLSNVGCGRAGGATTTMTQAPVLPPLSTITVAISPSSLQTVPGSSITFSASVAGTTNTAVNWSVQESNGGAITSAGIYTAPLNIAANPSTFHVIATSQADLSKHATAAVVVSINRTASAGLNVYSANVLVNGRFDFRATGFDKGTAWTMHWSVREGSAGGTIVTDANDPTHALYTAPATVGTFHVVLVAETVDRDPYGEPWVEVDGSATLTVLTQAAPGTFVMTGSMITERGGFTATLLRDGRVLMAGGDNSFITENSKSSPSTAEIYDPLTGAFTATGNLTSSRYGHVAVPLKDGRVFLAGGSVCIAVSYGCTPSALSSAEIYDPAAGTFTATATMLATHPCPNAMLLPNGKVLILGGAPGPVTAEIYDPATSTFTAANDSNSRELFPCVSAILLANGKVLIAPNPSYYDDPGPSQLEIFDPVTGQYTTTPPISGPSGTNVDIGSGTTLTLLNSGLVLVAGSEHTVCTSAGCSADFDVTSWLFDPASGSAQITGSMGVARALFAHTLLQDGTVLLTGGISNASSTAELYDPKSGTFSSISSMNVGRYLHTATPLNDGRVLIVGGDSLGGNAELYYPSARISQASVAAHPAERQ